MSQVQTVTAGPLELFHYKGKTYATGLFRLHDEMGFPLACSLDQCSRRGWIPCLSQFVADALRSGWSKEQAERAVDEAKADAMEVSP